MFGVLCVVLGLGLTGGNPASPGAKERVPVDGARASVTSAGTSSWPGGQIDPALWNTCSDLGAYQAIGPTPVSVYLAGWSDTSKLGQALTLGYPAPALAENTPKGGVWQGGTVINGVSYECSYGELQLDDNGTRELPPVTASFTGFNFMPITATAHLSQYGSAPVKLVFAVDQATSLYSEITAVPVTLRLSNVTVNGIAVDVGNNCRTTGPLTSPESPVAPGDLVLSGGDTSGDPEPLNTVVEGGTVEGLATIPDFVGCVTPQGENLNPLLDATVSGPGNLIKVDQGPLCGSAGLATSCVTGTTQANATPLWTVSGGGKYTGSNSFSLQQSQAFGSFYRISCSSSEAAGDIPDSEEAPRGPTGSFGWTGFTGCTGAKKAGADGTTWTVRSLESPSLDLYIAHDGIVYGDLWNISLLLTGTGVSTSSGTCTAQVTGFVPVTYDNSSSTLSVASPSSYNKITNQFVKLANSDCPEFNTNPVAPAFSYPLSPGAQVTSP